MSSVAASTRYRFGRFELVPGERQLFVDGAVVRLGPHAFDLLVVLVERSGRLVTKDELLGLVWPRAVVEENTLQVHVSTLRKLLGADAIATVAGRGYRFAIDVAHDAVRAARPRHNLPQPTTSFIGRETEIAQVKHLLTVTRLLTLTGAGGCGKTRLALQVTGDIADTYADGAWLVELAPLAEAALVPQAVARALSVDEQPGKPITDTLAESLKSRNLLVVLDNAEHLLGACAELADRLLRQCARLSFLVTSRERLGIAGELTHRVPSLSVPDAAADAGLEVLTCEAARLFIERARLQRPAFQVTAADAAAIASICRRLDGIALAIELAAPRIRHMSLQELNERIEHRFGLLTGGSRAALPRHRTLRSLIDWSYDLLADAEKTLLQRVSVFAGGWSLDAAERVCCGPDDNPGAVPDLLKSLADKNLIGIETTGKQTRFGMLETVRHYARDCLRETGDEGPVRARHVETFVALAERLDSAVHDAEHRDALSRLDAERDNVRAALAWCEATAALSLTGLRLAGLLYRFWEVRAALTEGRSWVARLLAAAPATERGEVHAQALHTAGVLAYMQADFEEAEVYTQRALALGHELDDRRQVARAIGNLGNIALALEDFATARARYAETLAIARETGNTRLTAHALSALGLAALEAGDLLDAQVFLQESIAIGDTFGPWSASRPRMLLGSIRCLQGDRQTARRLLTEAAAGSKEIGDRGLHARVLGYLALLDHDEGDDPAAATHLAEALARQHELDERVALGFSLQAAACLVSSSAGPVGVARLLGAAQRLRAAHHRHLNDFEMQERHTRLVTAAREVLGDDAAFDRAWNEGKAMSQAEVVRYAVALLK